MSETRREDVTGQLLGKYRNKRSIVKLDVSCEVHVVSNNSICSERKIGDYLFLF
jgi:hypothetical protein